MHSITKKTFREALAKLRAAVTSADVIAIDTELSGLHRTASEQAQPADSPQTRFDKLRASAQAFAVLQFGVATFTWDATIGKYIARAFNFPIFPHQGKSVFGLNRRFLVEAGAIDFLAANSFSFDDTFRNGIPYVRYDEERDARARIAALEDTTASSIPIDDSNREFVETSMSQVDAWLKDTASESVSIAAENAFKKRLIHQEIRIRHNHRLSTKSRGRDVVVAKNTEAEREKALSGQDDQKTKLVAELEYLVGFRHVIEAISKSNKPVVGHNMYLDLCQTIQTFCFELPETVDEFKSQCHTIFPVIFDTKLIANSDPLMQKYVTNSALQELVSQLAQASFVSPDIFMHPDFTNYASASGEEKFHEAAYDAYITGASFLKMMHRIAEIPPGQRLNLELAANGAVVEGDSSEAAIRAHLMRFANKLNVMRSDEPVLNLIGAEGIMNISWLCRTHTILALCHTHVGHSFVRWIDATSCYVAVSDRARVTAEAVGGIRAAVDARRVEEGGTLGEVRVLTHAEFLALESGNSSGTKRARTPRAAGETAEDGEIDEEDDDAVAAPVHDAKRARLAQEEVS
ncbi:hypothetical protein HDU84_003297 [Entophlyctis sp. JEL0112]|nr:hypothetical protein HDU84_003297 [Entophlyctis sp. JEL0112]